MTSLPPAVEAMAAQRGHNELGQLPVWDLGDLYPGNESSELKADLDAGPKTATTTGIGQMNRRRERRKKGTTP